jgi:hypothetical protein
MRKIGYWILKHFRKQSLTGWWENPRTNTAVFLKERQTAIIQESIRLFWYAVYRPQVRCLRSKTVLCTFHQL